MCSSNSLEFAVALSHFRGHCIISTESSHLQCNINFVGQRLFMKHEAQSKNLDEEY